MPVFDLTTRFVAYLAALRTADVAPHALDTTTLVAKDLPAKRTADVDPKDLNTVYHRSLP